MAAKWFEDLTYPCQFYKKYPGYPADFMTVHDPEQAERVAGYGWNHHSPGNTPPKPKYKPPAGKSNGYSSNHTQTGKPISYPAKVEARLESLRVDKEAKERLQREEATILEVPSLESPKDIVIAAGDQVDYLVDGLIPRNGVAALSAPRKVGKTTFLMSLVRTIANGEKFLDEFQCHQPHGSIVVYDLEMGGNMLGFWLHRNGLDNLPIPLHYAQLRGKASQLNVLNAAHRERLAAQLRQVNCRLLVADPLGPLFRTLGMDENGTEIGRVVDAFVSLKQEAGIDTLIISLHAGHGDPRRPRGSSVLLDTPDCNLSIWKKGQETSAPRLFAAEGRDVSVDTMSYTYDAESGRLFALTGDEAERAKEDDRSEDMYDVLKILRRANAGISPNKVYEAMRVELIGCGRDRSNAAVDRAVAANFAVTSSGGRGGGKLVSITQEGLAELDQRERVMGEAA